METLGNKSCDFSVFFPQLKRVNSPAFFCSFQDFSKFVKRKMSAQAERFDHRLNELDQVIQDQAHRIASLELTKTEQETAIKHLTEVVGLFVQLKV